MLKEFEPQLAQLFAVVVQMFHKAPKENNQNNYSTGSYPKLCRSFRFFTSPYAALSRARTYSL
ncbi:MAG: hypothetical protein NC548_31680, partial [Lachnospiraceae bacterium]|nr:hypothetical protein [Lachnospiraceae bacterium]